MRLGALPGVAPNKGASIMTEDLQGDEASLDTEDKLSTRQPYEPPQVRSGPIFERQVLASNCTYSAPACKIPPNTGCA